jgi:poly(A) polymerase
MNHQEAINHKLFRIISEATGAIGQRSYVVGGFVRDLLLFGKSDKDVDIVTVGSGIKLAREVASLLGHHSKVTIFKNFGTAMVKSGEFDIEFVGARKESYSQDTRKPAVEEGTLEDDQRRRDFTINAMSISLNSDDYGTLLDPFSGVQDLHDKVIRTPLDPEITFSDDPLRMLRAIRFAARLGFTIHEQTFEAIQTTRDRIGILSMERIADELNGMMMTPVPSEAFFLMDKTELLPLILPEVSALKGVERINNIGHKDNFLHTLEVLDNLASMSDHLWLRWAALLHDIAKPKTKKFSVEHGWSFHGHEVLGVGMTHRIFQRLRLPLNEPLKFVQKMVQLHLRPIALVESNVTDSAVRRLLFEAGDDIDHLMMLCKADITSKNEYKKSRYRQNFELVEQKLVEIEEKDKLRKWQPPITGEIIMETFRIEPSRAVGLIKTAIREAILDGAIPNEYSAAFNLMLQEGKKLGLKRSDV